MSFGSFTIGEQLASNGLVTSWQAFNANQQRHWLAAVPTSQIADPAAWARCKAEMQALRNAAASRVCAPVEWGESDGQYWAVYEWLEGDHIGRRAVSVGLPPAPVALNWGVQVIDSLITLQKHKQTHRLISPASVFINENEQAKLLHAGWGGLLAKCSGGILNPALISVLPFAPPEAVAGLELDEAADVYGLGATLYYLICGLPPHWADDPMSLAESIQGDAINFDTPAEYLTDPVLELLMEMLAKDPEERPVNLAALQTRLDRAANDLFAAYQQAQPQDGQQAAGGPEDFSYPDEPTPSPGSIPALPQYGDSSQEETGRHAPVAPAFTPPPPVPMYSERAHSDQAGRAAPPVAAVSMGYPDAPVPEGGAPPPALAPAPAPIPKSSASSAPRPVAPPGAKGSSADKIRLAVAAFIGLAVIAVVGYTVASVVSGGDDEPDTMGLLDAEKELAAQTAVAESYLSTIPKLKRLGTMNGDYRKKYGVWAAKTQDFSEFGMLAADRVDGWGFGIDVRQEYIVSAGADRKWDTSDDVYVDSASGAWGGHFPRISLKPETNKMFAERLREMETKANADLQKRLEAAVK
ncbi:MAG: protein kinase [Candidatus Sumerlaeia bacterium]|nr:protein kinase [Candidatus Sumerlaeia bacterium]